MRNLQKNGIAILVLGIIGCSIAPSGSANAPPTDYLDQGWSVKERENFYRTSQGSRLIPYSWYVALDRPSGDEKFAKDSLARFGYLPSASNPPGLPVGFVRDVDEKRQTWLGMTCAACHTSRMTYRGTTVQIDGGPADADLYAFLSELGQALEQTFADNTKFADFASNVIKQDPKEAPETKLRARLHKFLRGSNVYTDSTGKAGFTQFVKDSKPSSGHEWGPARADAFGMIFNRVTSIDLGIPRNSKPPNAPVSYPFLWDTSLHDKVQWNGAAPNRQLLERLARNVGEVLGVFATIHLPQKPALISLPIYRSSVRRHNLIKLENSVSRLESPVWPEKFLPSIDVTRAQQGEAIFRARCSTARCHPSLDRDKRNLVRVNLIDVGTDPTMSKECRERMADTGGLEGVISPVLKGKRFGKEAKALDLVTHAVVGTILSPFPAVPESAELNSIPANGRLALDKALKVGALRRSALDVEQRTPAESELGDQLERQLKDLDTGPPPAAYEARALNGIWATAPYLHNGSVSSLYELLLPASERAKKFSVGSREFDPRFVGFKSGPADGSFQFDTSVPGNFNTGHEGHEYGTDLSDPDRGHLIEYLKTLGADLSTFGKGPIPPTDPPSRPGPAETQDNAQIEEISADQTSLQVRSGGRTLILQVKTPELQSVLKQFRKGDQLGSLDYEEVSGKNILKSLAAKQQPQNGAPRLLGLLLSALLLCALYLILLRGNWVNLC